MAGGAPEGNDNAAKGTEFRNALRRVLARRSGETASKGLEKIADQLAKAAENGEAWAVKEVADRFDGKPAQAVEHSGEVAHSHRLIING